MIEFPCNCPSVVDIRHVVRKYLENPDTFVTAKQPGRSTKLSSRDSHQILRKTLNSTNIASEIAKECGVNFSKWTIARAIKKTLHINRGKKNFFLHYSDLEDQQRPGKSCDTGEKVSRG